MIDKPFGETIGLMEKEITSLRCTLNSNREEEKKQLEQGKAGRKLLRISWRTIFLHMKISIRPRKSARSLESDKKIYTCAQIAYILIS